MRHGVPPHVIALSLLAALLLATSYLRSVPPEPLDSVSELDFLAPGDTNALQDQEEAKSESDAYFAASPEPLVEVSAQSAAAAEVKFNPLDKGSVAREIFNAHGKRLTDRDAEHDYAPAASDPAKLSQGVHIITSFFRGSYENRRFSEILATLAANLENPHVALVHALWEKESPAQYFAKQPQLLAKLVPHEVKRQPTYATLFAYANRVLLRGSVAVITNADIYFDSSLQCIRGPDPADNSTTNRRAYALSRRHTHLCGINKADHGSHLDLCREYVHSHDAFVFAPPVAPQVIARTNHLQNRYGAENIVIWELLSAGYHVLNPCRVLKAYHLHCSLERHYQTKFIDGSNGSGGPNRHGTVWPGTVRYSTSKTGWKPMKNSVDVCDAFA